MQKPSDPPGPEVYVPFTEDAHGQFVAIRILRRMDRQLPLTQVRTMRQWLDRSMSTEREIMALVPAFAAALALATLGLSSVTANTVSRRRREIGLRMRWARGQAMWRLP